ncbi:hypothetical protein SRHO_G00210190 [Serrasalmus rhombeus]
MTHSSPDSGLRRGERSADEEQMNESEDDSARGGVNETIDCMKEAEAESTFRNVRALPHSFGLSLWTLGRKRGNDADQRTESSGRARAVNRTQPSDGTTGTTVSHRTTASNSRADHSYSCRVPHGTLRNHRTVPRRLQ